MMTLFEAIEHAEQKAKDENCCCREDHAQLAKWLKELALRRSVSPSGLNLPVYDPFSNLNTCYNFQR